MRDVSDEAGICRIRTCGKTIELLDINQKIQNMYLRVRIGGKSATVANVNLFATDEANQIYYALPGKTISSSVERAQYFRMQLSGRSEKVRIVLPN